MQSGIPAAHYASIGVALVLGALSILTWRRDRQAPVNVTFLVCFGLLAGYELTEGLFRAILFHTGRMVLPLHFANNVLIVLVAPTFLHFCSEFPRRGNLPRGAIQLCYAACAGASLFTFSDQFIADRRAVFEPALDGFVFDRRFGPLFGAVNGVATAVAIVAFFELIRKLRAAHSATERTQLQFLLIGAAGTAGSLLVAGLLLPLFFNVYSLIPIGNLAPILLCAGTAYALSTQGMFDIPDTLLKSALALFVPFSALVSAGLFLRIVYGAKIATLPGGFLAVAAVAVFAAQLALLRLLPHLRRLYPRQSDAGVNASAFDRVAADLLLLRSGEGALHAALSLARSTLGAREAALVAIPLPSHSTEADGAQSALPAGQPTIVATPGFGTAAQHTDLAALLPRRTLSEPVYFDMLPAEVQATVLENADRAQSLLADRGVAVAAPLGSDRLHGALFLTQRRDGRAYLPEELRQMGRLARALGIALENRANHRALLEVESALRRENAALADFSSRLSDRVSGAPGAEIIYGKGLMKDTLATAERVATADASVVLYGETGTGKELVAEFIHRKSRRADGPLVRVNCAAIPESLLENELFGHERGAFTGADRTYRGRFEQAHGGTLFLDEIAELPSHLQPKLLRVLQERRFERLGGERTIAVDVRFVFATHQDLEALVRAGAFREDLFYRINVITIRIPPLRERPEDVPLLVREFAARIAAQHGMPEVEVPAETLRLFARRDWPGNVRQLQNLVVRAAFSTEGTYEPALVSALLEEQSPAAANAPEAPPAPGARAPEDVDLPANLSEALIVTEKRLILAALEGTDGNKAEAARRLGLHPPSLLRKLRKLGL